MQEENISFGAEPSAIDYRTVTADMIGDTDVELPKRGKVPLNFPTVNDLCDQRKLGVCTKCGVRMAAEEFFKDGVRLDEYWGYLIGKTLYDDVSFGRHFEGSSALTMLKAATKYGIPSKAIRGRFPLKVDGTYDEFIAHFRSQYQGAIPGEVLTDAAKHKIPGYYKLELSPVALAKEMNAGRIVIGRFAVGTSIHRDINNKPSRLAKDLLPLRAPSPVTAGHIMAMNEWDGLDASQLLAGPNSWSKTWCADNVKNGPGYYNFVFGTLAPYYFTEAWVIRDIPEEVVLLVKDLPAAKNFKHRFESNIEMGEANNEVKNLHIALVIMGYLDLSVAEWGTYGRKTAAAVLQFQREQKLLPDWQLVQNGGRYVYGLTRDALNRKFT